MVTGVDCGHDIDRDLLLGIYERMKANELQPGSDDTQIFITPGYQFRTVTRLVTNFHLPKSTLMMLVSAFAGYERIRTAYAHAIERHTGQPGQMPQGLHEVLVQGGVIGNGSRRG